jgi:hypothetical protein
MSALLIAVCFAPAGPPGVIDENAATVDAGGMAQTWKTAVGDVDEL